MRTERRTERGPPEEESTTLSASIRPAFELRNSGSSKGPAISSISCADHAVRHPDRDRQLPLTGIPDMLLSSESVDGIKVAPARPSSARAAISISALVAKAASTDAVRNSVPGRR